MLSELSGIDIWYLKLDRSVEPHDLSPAQLSVLSADEHLRASQYPSKRDATLFLASRILLRTSLSQYAKFSPELWTFGVTSTGRPLINSPDHEPQYHFNLSHTDGMVVCAISRIQEIGIDVENVHSRMISMAMAKKYLALAEFKNVENLGSEQRLRALLQYWTLKEAYAKARGRGIGVPFTAIECELCDADSDCSVRFFKGMDESSSAWFFRQIKLSEDHVCSLAYMSSLSKIIKLHEFKP